MYQHPLKILENKYNELFNKAVLLNIIHNPCNIKNGKCNSLNFCCNGCKYLGEKGCTTKALMCKLWFCTDAKTNVELNKEKHDIMSEAYDYGFIIFRGSFKERKERYFRNIRFINKH